MQASEYLPLLIIPMKLIYGLILLFLSGSCLTVSTEQRRMIRQFAKNAENFSAYPEKIGNELADIRESRGIFYANSTTDAGTHLEELDAILKERRQDDKISAGASMAFKLFDRYATGVAQLSSDLPFKRRSLLFERFGTGLDTLVGEYNRVTESQSLTPGVGFLLSSILDEGTRWYLMGRQYKLLRKYVVSADTLVSTVCKEMEYWLNSASLRLLIQNEETGVQESFSFYFTKRSSPPLESDKAYIDLRRRVERLDAVRLQSVRAVRSLAAAHHKLAEALSRRRTVKETLDELNGFYRETERLRSLLGAISPL